MEESPSDSSDPSGPGSRPPERNIKFPPLTTPAASTTLAPGARVDGVRVEKPMSITKVAIPRQHQENSSIYRIRTPRACESCRRLKTKCSGNRPACQQCRALGIECHFTDSWKEKTENLYARQVSYLSEQVQSYKTVLDELRNSAGPCSVDQIKSLLNKHGLTPDNPSNPPGTVSENQQEDEPSSPSSVGSLNAIDRVEEDINENEQSRATGFMGKSSDVRWMQQLQIEADRRASGQPVSLGHDQGLRPDNEKMHVYKYSYHLDDLDLPVAEPVQPYEMPPRDLADRLFGDYLTTVHPFFPIINQPLFTAQFHKFFDSAARPGDKWMAILNMVFAIAAKHAHLVNAPWCQDANDHNVYFSRARVLSLNGDVILSHPDLQQVQVEGLMAYYLLATNHINRSWRISALAVRSASSVAINMKNTSQYQSDTAKEARYKVWWCVYTLEHLLAGMTGRSTCVTNSMFTTPLPVPFEDHQLQEPAAVEVLNNAALRGERINNVMTSSRIRHTPSNLPNGVNGDDFTRHRDTSWVKNQPTGFGLCYLYYCDLIVISQEIVTKLYSVDSVMVPWRVTENQIRELSSQVSAWFASLPPTLDFTRDTGDSLELLRCKLHLAFQYYSARIVLGRPCLCRRDSSSENPSLSQKIAVTSLDSALCMLALIPDEPDAIQLYRVCPWWVVLHHIMQASTALLIELSFGSIHMPNKKENYFWAAKKAVRWLHAMSKQSVASERAWELCDHGLRKLAAGMGYDMSDMPLHPSQAGFDLGLSVLQSTGSGQPTTASASTDLVDTPTSQGGSDLDDVAQPSSVSESELMSSLTTDAQTIGDTHFPYDPISGEFMESFFPYMTQWR